MRVTITEVARRAGVGKATVSRVLNGKDDVDPVTAERVRQVIAQTGYVPSVRAVGLARGRTHTVGLLVPSMAWLWISEVMQGVADVVEAAGYGLLLYTLNRGEQSMTQFASQVSRAAFDGLLAIEPPGTLRYLKDLHASGVPVVLIDDRAYHPDLPSVVTTHRQGGYSAAAHLLGAGRRNLAVVSGPGEFGCSRDRLGGFLDCLGEHGLGLDDRLVAAGDFVEATGYEAARQFLSSGLDVDGIFAHSDLMALGVLRALRKTGRRIPDDVAVVGFDDLRAASHAEPPLTTVRQPLEEMGATAARLLLSHLQGEPLPAQPVVLPTCLVIRGTTPLSSGG